MTKVVDVRGTRVYGSTTIYPTEPGGNALVIRNAENSLDRIKILEDGSIVTGTTTVAKFNDADGCLEIAKGRLTGNLIMDADDAHDIGTSTERVKSLYVHYLYAWQLARGLAAQDVYPLADNKYVLGRSDRRWANVYAVTTTVGDLILENEGARWRIIERDDGLYAINERTGKVYRISLEEVGAGSGL